MGVYTTRVEALSELSFSQTREREREREQEEGGRRDGEITSPPAVRDYSFILAPRVGVLYFSAVLFTRKSEKYS